MPKYKTIVTDNIPVPPPIPMTKAWLQGLEDLIKDQNMSQKPPQKPPQKPAPSSPGKGK